MDKNSLFLIWNLEANSQHNDLWECKWKDEQHEVYPGWKKLREVISSFYQTN